MKNKKPIIINLFGSPSSGKSSIASKIFSYLKSYHINAEIVPEIAKQMIYQHNEMALKYQFFIGNTQLFWQKAIEDSADVVIAESPYILSIIYNKSHPHLTSGFMEEFHKQNNINYFLKRSDKNYQASGRIHSIEETRILDKDISDMLKLNSIYFQKVPLKESDLKNMLKEIKKKVLS